MNRISIHIESDGFNAQQAQAFANFAATLSPSNVTEPIVLIAEDDPTEGALGDKPKKSRNRTAPKTETKIIPERDTFDPEAAKNTEVVAPEFVAPEVVQPEDDDLMGDEPETTAPILTVTREQIRSKVSEKQAVHKDAIRAKLQNLNAENVTKLAEAHFGNFYSFLESLK